MHHEVLDWDSRWAFGLLSLIDVFSKIVMSNMIFDFILQGDILLGVVATFSAKVTIFILVARGRKSSHLRGPSEISFTFNFYKNVSSRDEERSVVTIFTD